MKLKRFTVVHNYRKSSLVSGAVSRVRYECRKIVPRAKVPKLGDHTTAIPPFIAHCDEMKYFSMGLNIARALYEATRGVQSEAKTGGIYFFRNPENDALVVKVLVSNRYKKMVEKYREEISLFADWVFPPHENIFNPHLCIAEGAGIYEKLQPHMRRLELCVPSTHFSLPFPQIMVKVTEGDTSRWEEYDPNTP